MSFSVVSQGRNVLMAQGEIYGVFLYNLSANNSRGWAGVSWAGTQV